MRGRVVIVPSGTVITPFGEPAHAMWFSGETIAETQDRAFGRMHFEVVRTETVAEALSSITSAPAGLPVLVMLDRIYVSEKAAQDFVKSTTGVNTPCALGLSMNASVDYTRPLQTLREQDGLLIHSVVRVDGAQLAPDDEQTPAKWLADLVNAAQPVEVEKREIVHEIPLPTVKKGERPLLKYPITSTVVVSIEHWAHVLWLNQIAFGIRWVELLRRKWLWGFLRSFGAFSLNPHRLMDRLVRKGRSVKVDPTAYVSASILGDNVTIGAHVTLKNCIICPGAIIQDHAVLLNCVIGDDVLVLENTFMVSSAVMPKATVGNYKLQVSLIGREAYINVWASFVDARFAGSIKVQKDGKLVSSERSFMGSAVGHRAQVAGKVLIQPGREIPNDTVIVMRPDEVIRDIDPDLPPGVPMVRHEGRLVPLGQERKTST